MSKGFWNKEHALNYQAKVQKNKSKKQPAKILTGEELAKFAESMGLTVSVKHVPPKPKATPKPASDVVEIVIDDLPSNLRKFL